MRTLFSADNMRSEEKYRQWLEFSDERFMPMVHTRTDQDVFNAAAKGVNIGDLEFTRSSFNALILEATPRTIRHPLNKPDILGFSIKYSGECIVSQYDRTFRQGNDDISIVDANEPFKFAHLDKTDHLIIQIPRVRLESVLGSAKNFAAMNMKQSVTGSLVKSFFHELLRVHPSMSQDTTKRMASVGVDLIVACVAESMATVPPEQVRANVAVQRAKAYIEANLSSLELSPGDIAAAAGVSLRQLQLLFKERGHHISDWLWRRRLEVAAERLASTGFAHLSIGALAYGCGFPNQGHFSRRFKNHFGMRPNEYRQRTFHSARQRK